MTPGSELESLFWGVLLNFEDLELDLIRQGVREMRRGVRAAPSSCNWIWLLEATRICARVAYERDEIQEVDRCSREIGQIANSCVEIPSIAQDWVAALLYEGAYAGGAGIAARLRYELCKEGATDATHFGSKRWDSGSPENVEAKILIDGFADLLRGLPDCPEEERAPEDSTGYGHARAAIINLLECEHITPWSRRQAYAALGFEAAESADPAQRAQAAGFFQEAVKTMAGDRRAETKLARLDAPIIEAGLELCGKGAAADRGKAEALMLEAQEKCQAAGFVKRVAVLDRRWHAINSF
jgi:hypothetical protein